MITLIKRHCCYWTRSLCSDDIARNSMMLAYFEKLKVNQTLDTLILQPPNVLMHVNFHRRSYGSSSPLCLCKLDWSV